MATVYKTFRDDDITNTRTLIHENVPITGTILSGTYNDRNIKEYGHGMWQSVYDYSYLSSSANQIFDITCGYPASSALSSSTNSLNAKKIQIYNTMAQILMGYDTTGSIQEFDQDGNIAAGGNKLKDVFFVSFSRLLVKDEIKKGSFRYTFISGAYDNSDANVGTLAGTSILGDYGAASDFRTNSPAGEYGILYTGSTDHHAHSGYGLIFYQAGVIVVTGSLFDASDSFAMSDPKEFWSSDGTAGNQKNFVDVLTGSTIAEMGDAIRYRTNKIQFSNTTEMHSSIYFCRANHNEFNYSSNSTYVDGSKIRVKDVSTDPPVSYITEVGLYGADNELLAVAKLSEPLKKTSSNEITLRTRLDF